MSINVQSSSDQGDVFAESSTSQDQGNANNDTVFNDTPTAPAETYSEWDIKVGVGTKYKSREDAIKALYHAQEHIKTLESENAGYKEKVSKAKTSEDLLNELKNLSSNANDSQSQFDMSKIADLIKNTVNQELTVSEKQRQETANRAIINTRLINQYGSEEKAKEAITRTASELGVGVNFLKDAGMQNPTALFKLMGLDSGDKTKQTVPTVPHSTVPTKAPTSDGIPFDQGTENWWKAYMKKNPNARSDIKTLKAREADIVSGKYFQQ